MNVQRKLKFLFRSYVIGNSLWTVIRYKSKKACKIHAATYRENSVSFAYS